MEGSVKPGRELDALIAEKVFGWKNNKNGPTFIGERANQIYANTGDWKVIDCPNYSEDIEDAWLVVEELSPGNGDVFNLDRKNGWTAKFRVLNEKEGRWIENYAYAETAPMAICLAALKAVG